MTQNGKFHEAAQLYKSGKRDPERVRVYEKIQTGIWSYNGVFHLVDSWRERDEYREVTDAITDVRDTVNRVARRAASLYEPPR